MEGSETSYMLRLKGCFMFCLTVTIALVLISQVSPSVNRVTVMLENYSKSSDNPKNTHSSTGTADNARKSVGQMRTEELNKKDEDSKSVANLDNNNFTAVLLLTYMRSGSSLTGDILQQPDDAFYAYEPLRIAALHNEKHRPISFLNGTVMKPGGYDLRNVYYETLLGWLTCDFSRVYLESFLHIQFLSFGNKLNSFRRCILNITRLEHLQNSAKFMDTIYEKFINKLSSRQRDSMNLCVSDLREVCLRSKYRIVKTIRTAMTIAREVLQTIKGSKMIHLVRDPRATIESLSHRDVCPSGLDVCIQNFCEHVRVDTVQKANMYPVIQKRIYTVLYEDIAIRPVETSKGMYSFVGMEFTPVIAKHVYSITLGKNKKGCSVCSENWQIGKSVSSSKEHVDAWKQKMPAIYINLTQQLCSDVIKNYGYEDYIVPYGHK